MGQAISLGIQYVLAMFASNVTPAVIVAGATGLAFGGAEQVYLFQMANAVRRHRNITPNCWHGSRWCTFANYAGY